MTERSRPEREQREQRTDKFGVSSGLIIEPGPVRQAPPSQTHEDTRKGSAAE